MKKKRNKGFMLIETLLVSTFVLGAMTYIIMQFSALKRSYDNSFKYNTVVGLYGIQSLDEYAKKYSLYNTLKGSANGASGYIDTICSNTSASFNCTNLISDLNIEKVLFVKDSIFKSKVNTNYSLFQNDYDLYQFAKKISWNDNGYHWIIKYKDNTFATIGLTNI